MERVVLGLGSNRAFRGNSPVQTLAMACSALSGFISGLKVSAVYRTAAMYVTDQDDFYNMAVTGYFSGTPRSLLSLVHRVEAEYGRERSKEVRNGPRTIDIDIELFGHRTVIEPDLVIPHPRLGERAFVLIPMLDILPQSADVNIDTVEFLRSKSSALTDQRVQKVLGAGEFEELIKNSAAK